MTKLLHLQPFGPGPFLPFSSSLSIGSFHFTLFISLSGVLLMNMNSLQEAIRCVGRIQCELRSLQS